VRGQSLAAAAGFAAVDGPQTLTSKTLDTSTVYRYGSATAAADATLTPAAIVLADPAAADITLTLWPAATTPGGRHLVVNRSPRYTVRLRPGGADTLDGGTQTVYLLPGAWADLHSAGGTAWRAVASPRRPGQLVARVSRATTATITTSLGIPFDIDDYNPLGIHSTTVNPSRITPISAGYYRFRGYYRAAPGSGTQMTATMWKNGVSLGINHTGVGNNVAATGTTVPFDDVVYLNGSGDYWELRGSTGSGSAATTNVAVSYA
jgi:hypothetical protein